MLEQEPAPVAPSPVAPDLGDLGGYVVDGAGRIVAANDRALRLLRLNRADVLGRDHHDLLHRGPDGSTGPRAQCPLMDAVLSRAACSGSAVFFQRGDGRLLPVHWTATPAPGEDGTATLVLFHPSADDVTVRAPGSLSELERLALLAETTTSLTSTMNEGETLDRLAGLVLPRLADWVVVDLVDDAGDVRRARVVECRPGGAVRHPELEGPIPAVTARSQLPLSRALRGGAASLAGPQLYRGEPDSGIAVVQRELFAATGMHSAAIAPIRGAREVLGALTLGRGGNPVPFATRDLSLLEDITRRAGLAISNSRLYQRQRRVAETMQRHLLPRLPDVPGVELHAAYESAPDASQVGGDWYDAFGLPDGATALVVGDVVGHDLEAAAGMAQLRNMLRALAWSHRHRPSGAVDRLDHAMGRLADPTTATVLLGHLVPEPDEGWTWTWTNAGHPPPLLVTSDGRTEYLDAQRGLLLGTGVPVTRGDASVRLTPGSTLLLYTDGLVESRADGIEPGLTRLRRHAAALAHHALGSFCDRLLERVRPPDNDDDVALLAVRVPGRPDR
ncbi:SpoIIE family protein phosphatase [Streptomyces sp. SP17BM10]|uniref:PP2C family protein-serine/threonine phosphatase n=1 Tax=Streptomyces sp. SP17BM10 TaxID=3002530 RepID=UPI002E784DFE|nr:GAF domain-containing SpoIIE family protein phosphatase [Streptomyces sp. SP17BM10]MEE1786550.1 SpoIIE family protein phosphatase [Streptomyces sp. SP17BM10]